MNDLCYNLIAYSLVDILMLVILIYLIYANAIISKFKSKIYTLSIVFTIISTILETASFVAEQMGESYRNLNIISIVVGFTISPCIPIFLAALINDKIYKRLIYVSVPLMLNSLLFFSSVWNNLMFSVSPDNIYERGPLYYIYVIVYIYSLIILMTCNNIQSKEYVLKDKIYLCFLYLILILGTTFQVLIPILHTSWPCITMVLIMYYIFQRELQFRYDVLTHTLNRTVFEKVMKTLSNSDNAYLIMFDIDRFKNINDTYGHATGDKYLKQAASIIKNSFNSIGNCYRIGGDEFCVIALHTDEDIIAKKIEEMKKEVQAAKGTDNIMPNISYGYSAFNSSNMSDSLSIFYKADTAMYQNKKNIQ